MQPLPFEKEISAHPAAIKLYVDTVNTVETAWDVGSLAAGIPPVRKIGKELAEEGLEWAFKQGMKHLDDVADDIARQGGAKGVTERAVQKQLDDLAAEMAKRSENAGKKADDATSNIGKSNKTANTKPNIKVLNEKYLESKGFDAHEIKKDLGLY